MSLSDIETKILGTNSSGSELQSQSKEQWKQQLKTISINVGHGVIKQVPINEDSGLLWILSQDVIHGEPYDLTKYLTTGSRWSSYIDETSITIYVYFLLDINTIIIDRDVMTSCLLIYSLLEDVNFFKFLMKQLLQRWTLLSQILYNELDYPLPDNVRNDVFLSCPQMLLPKRYINDNLFMKQWITKYNEKIITINNVEQFKTVCQSTTSSHYDYNLDDGGGDNDEDHDNIIVVQDICDNTYSQPTKIVIINVNNDTDNDNDYSHRVDENIISYITDIKKMYTLENVLIISDSENEKLYNDMKQGKGVVTTWNSRTKQEQVDTTTYLNGSLYGPEIHYIDGNVFMDKYNEKSANIGDIKVYDKDGQLFGYTHFAPDGNSRTYEIYSSTGKIDYVKQTNKDHNGNWKITYANKYFNDGNYIESNQQEANFYDKDHKLVRRVTSPYSLSSDTKYDITYDTQGNQITITKLPSTTQVDLSLDQYPFMFDTKKLNDWV